MTRPLHIVALLDHSDHHADKLCRCQPEPVRDLAEPSRVAYLHRRPVPDMPDGRMAPGTGGEGSGRNERRPVADPRAYSSHVSTSFPKGLARNEP